MAVFVSPAHAKSVTEFIDSPGPCAYKHSGSMNKQSDSRKSTNESFGMGTSSRFFYDNDDGIERQGAPGPGTYTLRSAQGKQVTSDKSTLPIASFPRADRDRTANTVYLGCLTPRGSNPRLPETQPPPVPGAHVLPLRSLVLTCSPSAPWCSRAPPSSLGVGATWTCVGGRDVGVCSWAWAWTRVCDRVHMGVWMGSPKQQQSFWGRNSPGPAVYSPTASVGTQVSSVLPNVPKFGFGTADRFAYINIGQRAMQSPGPGSYSV